MSAPTPYQGARYDGRIPANAPKQPASGIFPAPARVPFRIKTIKPAVFIAKIAEIMVERARQGEATTEQDLILAGLSRDQIADHGDAARAEAGRRLALLQGEAGQ